MIEVKPTKKFKGKSPLIKLKNKLWNALRVYIFNKYSKNGKVDCYTCNAKDIQGSNRHLGHFITGSVCPIDLYFDPKNLRPQCMRCNCMLSGNWTIYEYNMIKEVGEEQVEELKKRRFGPPVKWYESDYIKQIEVLDICE